MRVDDGPEQKSVAFGKAGTLAPWLANFSFWVSHPESSSLTIRATDGGKQLGVVSAPLASAVWNRDSKKDLPAPTWLDLSDGVAALEFLLGGGPRHPLQAGGPNDCGSVPGCEAGPGC